MIVAFIFSLVVSLIIYPFVVGWTLGRGFMYKLGLIDFSGCASIHLVAGFCSLFTAIIIKPRAGRYEPLAIKRIIGDKDLILAHIQKEYVQSKMNEIAMEMPINKNQTLDE